MYPEVLGIWPMGAHCTTVDVHEVRVDAQIEVHGKPVWVGESQRDCITTGRVGLLRTPPRMRTGACVVRRRARLGAHNSREVVVLDARKTDACVCARDLARQGVRTRTNGGVRADAHAGLHMLACDTYM